VLSWLYLRAKCAMCKQPIPWRYPALELSNALLTFVVAYHFGLHWNLIPALLFSWALLALTIIDLETQLLPDSITKTFIVLGLLLNATALFGWHIALTTLWSSLLGFIIGYGVLWLLSFIYLKATGQHGMGGGDLKLLGMIGAILGWKAVLAALFIAAISGGIAAVGYIIAGKSKDYAVPFGPYLALGGWLMLMWPNEIINWYLHILS
jgi:leader peptidase (prepilin peptidase)/N-methyltransferase